MTKKKIPLGKPVVLMRRIRGEIRKAIVKKVKAPRGSKRRTIERVRVLNKKPNQKAGHHNYGRGYKQDKRDFNKKEPWEVRYRQTKGRR